MPIEPTVSGLSFVKSAHSFEETYGSIKSILEANDKIKIVKEIDHQSNASKVGHELSNTRLIYFGNPLLGTPIMQKNQTAALDLPQKILIYEQEGAVLVAYNHPNYLGIRHDVQEVPTLEKVAGALEAIVKKSSDAEVIESGDVTNEDLGLITVPSIYPFAETLQNIRQLIENNENLKLILELDHEKNAARVGLKLRPTTLLVFGNPNLGTPLMQASHSTAIDLPQKIAVWEDAAGNSHLSYNDPAYLSRRHGIEGKEEILKKVTGALANLSAKACQ